MLCDLLADPSACPVHLPGRKGSCLASSMAPPAGQQLLQLCLKVSGLDASSRSEKFNGRVRALVSQLVRHYGNWLAGC